MEAGAGEFVRHRLERHHAGLARRVALIPGLDRRREADGEVGRLDPGPGQIAIAALPIAGALALAVGDPVGRDQPAVGGVLADMVEAFDLAALQYHRQTEDDAKNGVRFTS